MAASEGAAVRDETGRTYTAAAVALPSLRLSALRLAVAMAVEHVLEPEDEGENSALAVLLW